MYSSWYCYRCFKYIPAERKKKAQSSNQMGQQKLSKTQSTRPTKTKSYSKAIQNSKASQPKPSKKSSKPKEIQPPPPPPPPPPSE
jgi:hypothetical protein